MPSWSLSPAVHTFFRIVSDEIQKLPATRPPSNISADELAAVSGLRARTDIVIKEADKGGNVVIMSREFYRAEALRQLQNASYYERLRANPLRVYKQELDTMVDEAWANGVIRRNTRDFLIVDFPVVATFYTLPKIHKNPRCPPGRPIVAGIGGLTEKACIYIDRHLQPFVISLESYVRDSTDLLNSLNSIWVSEDVFLATLDVEALYTSISHVHAARTCRYFLDMSGTNSPATKEFILTLLDFVLAHNFFTFDGVFYRQICGVAMGARCAPSVANLFLGWWEREVLFHEDNSRFHRHVLGWHRYIDDVLVVWQGSVAEFDDFLNDLNTNDFNILLTAQPPAKQVTFLDLTLTINEDGSIGTGLFRKETSVNSLLHYNSFHPTSLKRGIPVGQFLRLRRNCSEEMEFMRQAESLANRFMARGYPREVVNRALERAKNTPRMGLLNPRNKKQGSMEVPDAPEALPVAVIFSAIGKKTDIRERKSVVITPSKTSCVFQMDKPIYRPGQKVLCRLVCLDSQLKAVNEKFPVIYLQDPSNARLIQWLQKESTRGILSLEFHLIKDAPPGSYKFRVERETGSTLSHWFTVEEYVKPRFSMKVDAPNTISVLDESLKVDVSATYTYGKGVAGKVLVAYCKELGFYGRRKNCIRDSGSRCSNMTGELGPNGAYSGQIDLVGTFAGSTGTSIRLDVTLVEDGTGIQTKESHYVWVTSQPARISFVYDEMSQNYKRGLTFPVVCQLNDEKDQPITGQDIEIELDGKLIDTVQTDSEGKIDYGIDTTDMVAPNFTVKVSYKNPDQCYYSEWRDTDYPTAEYTAYRFYSQSGSFLQAKRPKGELRCGEEHGIDMQYIINPAGVAKELTQLFYLVLSNSRIVHSGQQDIDLTSSRNGSLTITFPVNSAMAPSANLVIYTPLKKELIAETVELNVENCFKNEVSMTFGQERGTPGSDAEVLLSGDPESICGIRVVDYSLLLLNSYEPFSANAVHNLFRTWFFGYNIAGFDVEDPAPPCEDPDKIIFYNGQYFFPVSSSSERDSYQNLKDVGLVVATDAQVRKPVVCDKNPAEIIRPIILESLAKGMLSGGAGFSASADASNARAASGSIVSLRQDFSETFMWHMVPLNEEGRASVTEKAPDSITKWHGSAFCLSDKGGFGMTKYPANYTTFQPFFVDFSKPYSIIRGEMFRLTGVAYNYLESWVKIEVDLEPSAAFIAELKEGTQNICVGPNGQAPFSWEFKTERIGEVSMAATAKTTFIGQSCDGPNDASQPTRTDTVMETILVEAEGIRQERTLTDLVLVKNTKSVLPVRITPPDSVVPDSITASIVAVGDIFGLSVRNLQDLVKKPSGRGDQSLGRVAPIPDVIDYLNNTGQLTDDFYQKAKAFMTEGYYRQLGFASGSAYRMFPNYGEEPNSWLTVYSYATMEKFKKHIFIDSVRQQQTLLWLENTQRLDNGCFRAQGNPFMKQDVDSDLHFTSFTAIALMESSFSLGMTLLDGAMKCLRAESKKDQKIEDEAMMLYAFSLAKDEEHRGPLLDKLMKKAISDGGTMYWEREDMPMGRPVPFFLPLYAPADVAITSYILLSMTSWPTRTEEDLKRMAQISPWITRQMNPNGGFGTSMDTPLAIKALAKVAQILYTPNAQQKVVVKRGNAEIANIDLNPQNRLVVNRQSLPDASGDYTIEIEGSGWCLVQTLVGYNIQVPKEDSAFSLALSTTSDNCINGVANTFNITVTLSYHGKNNVSNMALVKIRLLSGYTPDYWTLRELVNKKLISKHEDNNRGELTIYMNSICEEPQTFSFRVFMGQRVLNMKTSSATVHDYYEPDENGYASYSHPCIST
ncbi:ovostatin-like [Gastrophryne carolinensis]